MAGGHKVIFLGPGTLQLSESGKEYVVGDEVTLPDAQRASLMRAGMQFGAVPGEPDPAPVPDPPPPLAPAAVSQAAIDAQKAGRPDSAGPTQGETAPTVSPSSDPALTGKPKGGR